MEINIYLNEDSWNKNSPDEVFNGEIRIRKNNFIIETHDDGKLYRQFLSFDKIFAITYEIPYAIGTLGREVNLYFDLTSWSSCKPKVTLTGDVVEEESTPQYVVVISEGYKQYISLNKIFACSYEW